MDGTGSQILFTGDLDHLESVTLDIKEQKLYWAVTSRGVVRTSFLSDGLLTDLAWLVGMVLNYLMTLKTAYTSRFLI